MSDETMDNGPISEGTADLESRVLDHSIEELKRLASDSRLTDDLALALLARRDLTPDVIEVLVKNANVITDRRVQLAVAGHPKAPRHISVPLVRQLYTFELMQIALSATVLADIKIAAEQAIIARLEKITAGERMTLARRASGRVAAALLAEQDKRVIEAALDNPFLTEALVVRAVMQPRSSAVLVELVCRHAKWSVRRDVRIALLRNAKTPLTPVPEFLRTLPGGTMRDLLHDLHIPDQVRELVERELENRGETAEA